MDKLEFKITDKVVEDRAIPSVDIFINDKNLIGLLKEYELPFATKEGHPDIAGGYAGMTPEDFIYWFTVADWPGGNEHAIFTCSGCGEVGCWPMVITESKDNGIVKWSGFHQQHRGPESKASHWDYSNFPSFEFSKENYNTELAKLRKL